jgi:hypothetical protein
MSKVCQTCQEAIVGCREKNCERCRYVADTIKSWPQASNWTVVISLAVDARHGAPEWEDAERFNLRVAATEQVGDALLKLAKATDVKIRDPEYRYMMQTSTGRANIAFFNCQLPDPKFLIQSPLAAKVDVFFEDGRIWRFTRSQHSQKDDANHILQLFLICI